MVSLLRRQMVNLLRHEVVSFYRRRVVNLSDFSNKKRWGIEIMFKKMKQNFQLHYFYGENVNAIYTQVWCTLIAQLLLTVIQKMAKVKKAFSVVASLVRIHLISMLDIFELLRSTRRYYNSRLEAPPGEIQMKIEFK